MHLAKPIAGHELHCDVCGHPQSKVPEQMLFEGEVKPAKHICKACVKLCNEAMKEPNDEDNRTTRQ